MRRLASVLVASSRRTDKPDAPSADDSAPRLSQKRSRIFSSLSRKHLSSVDPPSLPPLVASDLANSSSSSSGSTTLRTPDDDGLPRTPSKKGSWRSWLGGKNATVSDHPERRHSPPWQSSQNALRPPKSGSNGDTDDASSQSDDPDASPDTVHTVASYSPQQLASARANTRTLIMNSLAHEPTPPPLLQSSDAVSFPRSCLGSQRLCRRETLESELHKRSLLARLDRLSSSEELSILPVASRPTLLKSQARQDYPDDVFQSASSVNLHSSGLKDWVSRPCFEDRLQLWTRSHSGEIIRTRIPGSHLGVAALEFSESLQLLAGTLLENDEYVEPEVSVVFDPALGFTLPPLALDPDPPATQFLDLEPLSPPSDVPKDSSLKVSSSPRLGTAPLATPRSSSSSPVQQQPSGKTTTGPAATNDPAPKRGVRFADDDGKDDQIPLGYVLRIRKNKEQKARFLREERERRERAGQTSVETRRATVSPQGNRAPRVVAPRQLPLRPLISLNEPSKPKKPTTVSRALQEEGRLRREAEKVEMEKLRRSRELARKQAEEQERTYIEELQATRARREASRAGRPLESAALAAHVPNRDRPAHRDSMHASLRRSSNAHVLTPELVFSPVSTQEGSPSSSVPATPGSQHSFSRPPSIYSAHTASSEDVRGREGKLASRRMSVVSDPAKGMLLHPPYDPRASLNPYAWINVSPTAVIPAIAPMPAIPTANGTPFYGADMPLLPPTAPFMVNQFGGRSRSYTGSAGQQSPLQSPTSLPRNYSAEGVSRNSSPRPVVSHHRRSSDDVARMAKTSGNPPGSYGTKTTGSVRVTASHSLQRSSWIPPEQGPTKRSSSLRPVSVHSPGAPGHLRRRID